MGSASRLAYSNAWMMGLEYFLSVVAFMSVIAAFISAMSAMGQ